MHPGFSAREGMVLESREDPKTRGQAAGYTLWQRREHDSFWLASAGRGVLGVWFPMVSLRCASLLNLRHVGMARMRAVPKGQGQGIRQEDIGSNAP